MTSESKGHFVPVSAVSILLTDILNGNKSESLRA